MDLVQAYVSKHLPDIEHTDYTSIIDERSVKRLSDTLDDAREKGARIINLNEPQPINPETRKFPMHLVLDTRDDMTIRRRETFGPLLMVLTYKDSQEVIDYVNSNDRPLALYPFTNDKNLAQHYIDHIMSGGVTVNDALFHVAQHDIPFGGVGPSGMGHYHGYEGFVEFSKMRPVFTSPKFDVTALFHPPYKPRHQKLANLLIKHMR